MVETVEPAAEEIVVVGAIVENQSTTTTLLTEEDLPYTGSGDFLWLFGAAILAVIVALAAVVPPKLKV